MVDDLMISVLFPYAQSYKGEPLATVYVGRPFVEGMNQKVAVQAVIQTVIEELEKAGTAYHHCDTMPSRDFADYRLIVGSTVVSRLSQLVDRAESLPTGFSGSRSHHRVSARLIYVGEFGEEQINQCLRLGGQSALEHARAWIEVGQRVVRGGEVSG